MYSFSVISRDSKLVVFPLSPFMLMLAILSSLLSLNFFFPFLDFFLSGSLCVVGVSVLLSWFILDPIV